MLVFETPKTGLLTVLLRTHNHMLSTQPLRLQTSTHTERVHGCKAWFLAKRSLIFWTCCVQCRRNTARHTRQHHLGTVSGPWAMEFKLRFLALVWHGSLQWCSVREFENNVRCTIDMPTFMPPKPTRNGPGTKELLQTLQNEGTRTTQDRFIFSPQRN